MSSSNNRFGRRTGRQSDDPRFEPQLSFNPKRPAARDAQAGPTPAAGRKPQQGLRVDREDAREFGVSFDDDMGRDDDFDPRTRREKALEQRVPEAERPLYHHLFDEQENRRRGFGWIAALASVAVVAIGAAFAWNNFMSRPAPANLFEPRGYAARGNTGYVTPQQPASNGDLGADIGSTPPAPAVPTPPTANDQPPTKDIAATPAPKSVPAEPPPPPKKTISEAAANPGDLGPPANPAPPPAAREQPAAAPAPFVAPPPKRETVKHETPRKEAAITPPKRAPAPAPAPQDIAPPPKAEPAAAPAVSPPPRRTRPQASGQPQPLSREAPAAAYVLPPQQRPARQPAQPDNLGPPPNATDTVTVDGVTYVNGQEPHSLGTIGASPQAASDAGMPPYAPPMPASPPPSYSARPYTPTDHDGGAPLPNDVIILPNGQMAVPNGR